MADTIPVLLDTDIGSDIDDAVALSYLLRQPRCELVGITTVTGDVQQRAACAQAICQASGREDIPIHCGASEVLLCGPGQRLCPQYAAIEKRPHRKSWPANTAVEYLRRTIRSRPGELTLLSIGPFTNIALLFALDPEIPALLKGFVSMAGVFFPGECDREWNVRVDPIAASIVYNVAHPRGTPRHLNVGLDVTFKCQLEVSEVRRRFTVPPLNLVREMAEVSSFRHHHDKITFHDPLTAAVLFNPELCTYADGTVTVPLDTELERQGRSPFTEGAGEQATHRVAKTVNPAAFFDEYFSVFAA